MAVDLEKLLRPVDSPLPAYPAKCMMLANGEMMVVRQISREEVPDLLPHVEPLIHVERDYYDIVSVRVYAELLGYYRHRVQDEYVLVGQVDGELAAIVNGRSVDSDIGMSYHTLAFKRGLRVGAHCFAAKMEYHLDVLKQKEVLIVAESPIGFRRWMIEYGLEKRFEMPHELGGCPSYSLTRELFDKARSSLVVGTRPVPEELMKKAMAGILPPKDPPKGPPDLLAATRARGDSTGTALRAASHPKKKGETKHA
ncbi:MAG: hypothetical protein HQM09_02175 [Candidatus Riflebacteria bacterium]|nr:hypothetical protein [Candidatus Riflebacteria bacterium]